VGLGLRSHKAAGSGSNPKFYRRPLGFSWLIGLVVIPLLIAAIGNGVVDGSGSANHPAATNSASNKPGALALSLAPLSISRSGNNITLSGDFPDDTAKAALLKSLKGALPPGVNIVDQIHINPNVDALDFANAGPVFKASAPITDFGLSVNGDTVTLSGTASSADQQNAIKQAAVSIWSRLNVVDNLAIKGSVAAPPPPGAPAPPPSPAPGPDPCANLQAAINAATSGPIAFANNGVSLTPDQVTMLTQVADKLKTCANAHATINGYTDNTGTEDINIPLSAQRARTVADFLAAHGVARDHLVDKGLGSVNPIAPNDTPDGRAKNRRVEIVVS
jgi:peptidoglycan-binding protein ArfA